LNVFLNENCKHAINIVDFVESLKITVNDLEQTGRLGYSEGITRIFIDALKQLDVTMRPLHCTDIKRETVYIKDQDNWEKENVERRNYVIS
jgi:alpha-D-ribose 1-methylphosphonate 5-triphosphate synthase subunit PhnL